MTIPFLKITKSQLKVCTCEKSKLKIKEKFALLKLKLRVYLMRPHIMKKGCFAIGLVIQFLSYKGLLQFIVFICCEF